MELPVPPISAKLDDLHTRAYFEASHALAGRGILGRFITRRTALACLTSMSAHAPQAALRAAAARKVIEDGMRQMKGPKS